MKRHNPSPFYRLRAPLLLLAGVIVAGTGIFYLIGGGKYTLLDYAYQTIITVTTVGYEDRIGISGSPLLVAFTALLAISGIGTATYAMSVMTAAIVEGDLANYFKERKMEKLAARLKAHTILCGVGETGIHIVEEYAAARKPLVVIEHSPERSRHLQEQYPDIIFLTGDATDETLLGEAGIDRAAQLITALHEDRDNMFLVVTARSLAPNLIIISKCVDPHRIGRFERAGANSVVSPYQIGGLRMASHALRPHVVNFLDLLLKAPGDAVRVEEFQIRPESPLCGKSLGDADFYAKYGVRVIGGQSGGDERPEYNLPDDWPLRAGAILFIITNRDQRAQLHAMAKDG
jgi:voltage-gated potassium channel